MRLFLLVFLALLGLDFAGCGDSGNDHHDQRSEKVATNLAKLPAADRATAEEQHHCPVSGEPLGSMGVPIKVNVKGRDVWLCCDGCQDKMMAEPDKYLASIKEQ